MSSDIRRAQQAYEKACEESGKAYDDHIQVSRNYRAGKATAGDVKRSERQIVTTDKAWKRAKADLERAAREHNVVINTSTGNVGIQAANVNGRRVQK